jgi:putative nucleotidyltransferase with HDIG domain
MLFPDRAPSRFSVAFRAGTTRNLQEQLADAGRRGIDDEPARSAERILTLVAALNRHDRATRGHSERVRAFNDLIAEELRLPQPDRDRLRWAALLHDVGKLEVPARILNKAGRPTEAEWDALRRHPEEGARIAAPLLGWLGPWAPAIVEHHERWDGTGYPRGLAGGEISLAGRIVAVADVFEVLTAPRPYRRPVSAGAARAELARCAGTQFDPAVVRAFLSVSLGRLQRVMGPVSWVAQLPFIGALPALQSTVAGVGRSGITAAATATGVGALTVSGVMGPNQPDRPGSHAGVPMSQAGPEAAGRRPANAGGAGSTADVDTTRPRSAGQAAPAAGKPIPGGAPRPADGTGGNDPAPPPRLPTSQAPLSVRLDLSDKLGAGVTLDQGVGVDVRLGDQTVSARTP